MKKFPKHAAFLFLIFFMVFGAFCLFSEESLSAEMLPYSVETPRDDFPVREAPDTYSDALVTLPQGTVLYPVAIENNWYRVPFEDNVYGYVHRDYITATETAASIATFPGATVRSEMNLESEGISLLSINTEVALTGYDGDWYRVTVYGSDAIGYLHGDSLKIPKKNLIDTSDPVDIVTDTQIRANTNANIRSGPGTNYDRVTTVSAGTVMTVEGQASDNNGVLWYQVTVNGVSGYIRSDLVDLINHVERLSGIKIVIDPGHGSYKSDTATSLDEGAIGPTGIKEKDVTLSVAQYLKAHLEYEGANVTMTRARDTGVLTLTDRAEFANNEDADLFISIHCNSYVTASVNGIETYYYAGTNSDPIDSNLANNRRALATTVQENLISDLNRTDRGVNTASYTVLKKSTMPSILVELMFISNPTEEQLLADATVQENAAKAMVKGILSYYGKS